MCPARGAGARRARVPSGRGQPILDYTILYYTILYYIIQCYTILYYNN